MEPKELVPIVKAFAAEDPGQRVRRVFHSDDNVFVAVAVIGAPRTDHHAELRPVLLGAGPVCEGDARAMHAQQPAATDHEFQQVLSQ